MNKGTSKNLLRSEILIPSSETRKMSPAFGGVKPDEVAAEGAKLQPKEVFRGALNTLVKPIAGILTGQKELLGEVLSELSKHFGAADIIGGWIPFDHTNYYADEMGENLFRCFVSFGENVEACGAINFKIWSKEIEKKFMKDGRRAVNIDPGYLDANKVVLITGKHGGHKIALAKGVWADWLLWYNKGWVALPWAFPDFRDGRLFPVFMKMRTKYKS